MQFVDTNIFLRYLTNDDPVKAKACLALFQKAKANKSVITTSESVIAEVVNVLTSKQLYRLSRNEVIAQLRPLLILPGLKLSSRTTFLRALEIYSTYVVDFEDALSRSHMEGKRIKEIYSYDMDFDQMEDIARLEP